MSDLKYILKIKRKLKGEEAGRAMLKDLAYSNKPVMSGTGERKELFSMAEKAFIQDNIINDPAEVNMYNRYIHLCNSLVDSTKSVAINHLMAMYSITRLNFTMIHLAEESLIQYDTPYIMTEQEYEEVRKRHLEESLKDENGEYYYYDIFAILERAFSYYKWDTPNKAPEYEHIYEVMRKYDAEPCKDEYLISQYNRVNHIGHYTKPDGTKVNKREMIMAIHDDLIPIDKGVQVDSGLKTSPFIHNRALMENIADELDKIKDTFTLDTDTPPFTLFSILEDAELYYPNLHDNTKEGEKQRKHFMTVFKELIDEVVKQIDKDFFNGDIAKWIKKGGDLLDVVYRADDLLNKGFPHILIETEAELMGWKEPYRDRVENAGIAVLKCSGRENSVKFRSGKGMNNPLKTLTSLYLNQIDDQKEEWIPAVEKSIYFLQAYNKGLELLAEYTGVKELEYLKKDTTFETVEAYNTAYYIALRQLDEEGRKKIKENYRPIRTDYKIPEERINKARSLLVGLEAFKDRAGNYEFMDTLTTFIPEEHQ